MADSRPAIDHPSLGRLVWQDDDLVGQLDAAGLRVVVASASRTRKLAARLDRASEIIMRTLVNLDDLTARAQSVHGGSQEQLGRAASETVAPEAISIDETPAGSTVVSLYFRSAVDSYAYLALDEGGSEFGFGAFMHPR